MAKGGDLLNSTLFLQNSLCSCYLSLFFFSVLMFAKNKSAYIHKCARGNTCRLLKD